MSDTTNKPDTVQNSAQPDSGREKGASRRAQSPTGRPARRPLHKDGPPRGESARGGGPKGAAAALVELDKDIMKLLVRRATLVSRIREGRDHASSPAAIQAEKAVRLAWEEGAVNFSRDPRFIRQLFMLLQDVKMLSKDEAKGRSIFTLAPPRQSISGSVTGPSATRTAQMRVVLSAALGRPLTLENILVPSALSDTVKACSQAGAQLEITTGSSGFGNVSVKSGSSMSFSSKTLFAGDDVFSLYMFAFLAAGATGSCRFNGGARLKAEDLAPLRATLPLLGARLAHIIPRSTGLPAMVESSGDIPESFEVPENLPYEAVCALLLAPLVWNRPFTMNMAALPAAIASAALAKVRPLHRDVGAEVDTKGPEIVFTPGPLDIPAHPTLPLDPVLSAYLLALPAFAGGSLLLKGSWPGHMPEAREVEQLLAWGGVTLSCEEGIILAEASAVPFSLPLQTYDLFSSLGPLYLAFAAKYHKLKGKLHIPIADALFPQNGADAVLTGEMLSRLGLVWDEGGLRVESSPKQETQTIKPHLPPWSCPDGFWGMAFALLAYMKPRLELANPATISEVMPSFWSIYNSLPEPRDPAQAKSPQEDKNDPAPSRRRIIAD
ncbi:chorismate mutase [Desulfovibrio sp. OttesenSCG-928-G15]|nr:chorismate mutase [Desulfovibrio sp. OttesenSCG-928-G15]